MTDYIFNGEFDEEALVDDLEDPEDVPQGSYVLELCQIVYGTELTGDDDDSPGAISDRDINVPSIKVNVDWSDGSDDLDD